MRWQSWCAALLLCLLQPPVQADPPKLRFSGFGSVVAGKLTSGSDYLADFQSVGIYDKELSFDPDSKFGLQMDANLQQGLSATVQVLARGSNAFEPHFDWAYVSYELTPTWTLQAGRKRLPLYYYSDFFDVAYTYKWVRPPADAYSLNFISYNGANLLYLNNWGNWDMIGNLYVGREHTERNELWEFILPRLTANTAFPITPGTTFETDYRNMLGGSLQGSYKWLKLRGTLLHGEVVQLRNKNQGTAFLAFNDAPFDFYGLAVVLSPGPL